MAITCPRCGADARTHITRTHGARKITRQKVCRICHLVYQTIEHVVDNAAIRRQLSAEDAERIFGKPGFKYKSPPPARK